MRASQTERETWMAVVLAAALDHGILQPDDVLAHASPEVLARHLPPDVMSAVLSASLAAGTMTAEVILRTVGPDVMARSIPMDILWGAVSAGARRAEIPA